MDTARIAPIPSITPCNTVLDLHLHHHTKIREDHYDDSHMDKKQLPLKKKLLVEESR
jgi:hypothetical protein